MHAELDNLVIEAVKEAELVGVLGESKPDVREMFQGVFKDPDWRAIEQIEELGL